MRRAPAGLRYGRSYVLVFHGILQRMGLRGEDNGVQVERLIGGEEQTSPFEDESNLLLGRAGYLDVVAERHHRRLRNLVGRYPHSLAKVMDRRGPAIDHEL